MLNKIAVILDEKNELSSIERCNEVMIYHRTEKSWEKTAKVQWQMGELTGINHIRNKINVLTEALTGCRVIAGRQISGLPYHIFDRKGFHIFETQNPISPELLESMREELVEAEAKVNEDAKAKKAVPLKPYSPDNNGIYYLNLIDLQQAFPEISSKKALRSFIEEGDFSELHLICRHLPPWIEASALRKNMTLEVHRQDDDSCSVIISAKEEIKK